ncbi:MAG: PA2169 family four-helix-bundle protein [Bacteroidia bacterium]|nr:PA2169 family four-helix-bundle protein [Bacteroidia bacterium]
METITKTATEKLISQLNNLVEINNDRIQGYEKAITETEEKDLKFLFRNMADHSRSYKNELSKEITALGGKPTEGTKNTGKIFRAWMNMKATLTGKNRKEILNSCEFGEDAALEAYDLVLNSTIAFRPSISKMIRDQKKEIQRDHNGIKSLHDSCESEM